MDTGGFPLDEEVPPSHREGDHNDLREVLTIQDLGIPAKDAALEAIRMSYGITAREVLSPVLQFSREGLPSLVAGLEKEASTMGLAKDPKWLRKNGHSRYVVTSTPISFDPVTGVISSRRLEADIANLRAEDTDGIFTCLREVPNTLAIRHINYNTLHGKSDCVEALELGFKVTAGLCEKRFLGPGEQFPSRVVPIYKRSDEYSVPREIPVHPHVKSPAFARIRKMKPSFQPSWLERDGPNVAPQSAALGFGDAAAIADKPGAQVTGQMDNLGLVIPDLPVRLMRNPNSARKPEPKKDFRFRSSSGLIGRENVDKLIRDVVENGPFLKAKVFLRYQEPPLGYYYVNKRIDARSMFDIMNVVGYYTRFPAKGWTTPLPKITVWPEPSHRLDCILPTSSLAKYVPSSLTIAWPDWEDLDAKIDFLFHETYWGVHLLRRMAICRNGVKTRRNSNYGANRKELEFLTKLRTKIDFFLRGKFHPDCPREEVKQWVSVDTSEKGKKQTIQSRAYRFMEVLKTINGLFYQRWLGNPEDMWSWDLHDRFVIGLIDQLINHEFFDKRVTLKALKLTPTYSLTKKVRGSFEAAHLGKRMHAYAPLLSFVPQLPNALMYLPYKIALTREMEKHDDREYLRRNAILLQNRAAGDPPFLMKQQAIYKLLQTVGEVPPKLTMNEKAVMRVAQVVLDEKSNVNNIFQGCRSRATFKVKQKGDFDAPVHECGTLDSIRKVYTSAFRKAQETDDSFYFHSRTGIPPTGTVRILDLETGKVTRVALASSLELGECIFWKSLEHVLLNIKSKSSRIGDIRLHVVTQPGKARAITMGRAALKIVLAVVAELASAPLKRLRSHQDGMSKEHQAWKFYERLFDCENRSVVFGHDSLLDVNTLGEGKTLQRVYRLLWFLSMDLTCATDAFQHQTAQILASHWLTRVGVGKWFRRLIIKLCYSPRRLFFPAAGHLLSIGKSSDIEDIASYRYIWARKGIWMGDPLTKVLLHLAHEYASCVASSSLRHWTKVLGRTQGQYAFDTYVHNPGTNEIIRRYGKALRKDPLTSGLFG
jgi:hypothetical protein